MIREKQAWSLVQLGSEYSLGKQIAGQLSAERGAKWRIKMNAQPTVCKDHTC